MVRNNMSDFSKTYTRSKKQKRVDEPEGVSGPIEASGASSGPILRPRTSRASQPAEDEIVEEEEEEGYEMSSDDNECEENYRMQFRHGKGPANDDDDDEDEEEDFGGRERGVEEEEEEEVMLEIRRPVNPSSHQIVNYLGMGKTEAARRKRREWPYGEPKDMASGIDYRFHTFFQWDFYSTAIIAKKKGIIAEARWIDWAYMERANNAVFRDVIDVCTSLRIKPLMGFRHSWNMEVIAQFYATVAFEEHESARKMRWMTEGTRYSVTFTNFARFLGLSPTDLSLPCIHRGARPMEPSAMKFMYPRDKQANASFATGLYSYYSVLNCVFRLTLTPRGGNPADISNFAKDLLVHMRPPGLSFSMSDFI
jgi:hypothetical protein